jgi:excisionase family DNA binding protein
LNHDSVSVLELQPFAVSPQQACRLLSIGTTNLYGLLEAGELASFRIGACRRIPVQSITDFMTRRLAAHNEGNRPDLHAGQPPSNKADVRHGVSA